MMKVVSNKRFAKKEQEWCWQIAKFAKAFVSKYLHQCVDAFQNVRFYSRETCNFCLSVNPKNQALHEPTLPFF